MTPMHPTTDNAACLTPAEQIEELREMLDNSSGHWRQVTRPPVITRCQIINDGSALAVSEPGPVTVVTFYISHRPDADASRHMIERAKADQAAAV